MSLAAAAALLAPAAAQVPGTVEPWPGEFVAFVPLPTAGEPAATGGDPSGEVRLRALWELGVRGVVFRPGQDPALARRLGFALCQSGMAGEDVLSLSASTFEELRRAYARERTAAVLVRPHCLSEPATRGELLRRTTDALASLPDPAPCGLLLGAAASTTRGIAPLDVSFSTAALAEFRVWLAARHGDCASLNRVWHTDFASLDEVVPLTADQMQARLFAVADRFPDSLAAWAEHRSFMAAVLASTVRSLLGCARAGAPTACGLGDIHPPAAYGGGALVSLLPLLDLYEVRDAGGARDLAMELAPPHARQLGRLEPIVDAPRGRAAGRAVDRGGGASADLLAARLADMLAHGMSGVLLPEPERLLEWDTHRPTPLGEAVGAALAACRHLAPFVGARLERSPVVLVESQPSMHAHWMLDVAEEGAAWVQRTSADEVARSTSMAARVGWVRLFEDLGLQPGFAPAGELRARLARRPPGLLVLPSCIALSDDDAGAIEDYVARGGVAVADGMLALYDERLVRRKHPALDGLFGLVPREDMCRSDLLVRAGQPADAGRLPSGAAASERGVRADVCERVDGDVAVQCEHRHGRGVAVYLNLAVCEYDRVRLDPEKVQVARDLRRRVQRVLDAAGVAPPVLVRGAGLPTCLERMLLGSRDGRRLLAVRVHALDRPALLDTLAAREAIEVDVLFARPVTLRVAGEPTARGPAASFRLRLDPWRGSFAEVLER